jgi:hypothetical protein
VKIKFIIAFIATVGTLGLIGCKPKDTTLSGQIFIVTRGSENIKLGLVEVQLIEKQQMVEFLQKKQAVVEPGCTSRKQEIEAAIIAVQKANTDKDSYTNDPANSPEFIQLRTEADRLFKQNTDEWIQNSKAGLGNTSGSLITPDIESLQNKMKEMQDKYNREQNKLMFDEIDAEIRLKKAKENLAGFPTTETYFSDFSLSVAKKTLSDADGKFSFLYPRDKAFALFAKAQRLVGDQTENYYWLVNAPSGAETVQVFLSNNNLVFSDPDGYFKIKPQPEAQPQSTP